MSCLALGVVRRVLIGLCVFAVALASIMVAACGSGEPESSEFSEVPATTEISAADPSNANSPARSVPDVLADQTEVFGTALPQFEQLEDDPAVGRTPPVVVGPDLLTGESVRIESQGRPMVVAFYAHWCPHCQAEVDDLTKWLESNELPAGVEFYAVSVLEDPTRGNHPPEKWLRDEGWQHPVVADTPALSVVDAFGLQSVPYLVAVDANNEVVLRFSGNIPGGPPELAALFTFLHGPPS